MSPQYKLTYFNGLGLAEITRLLFAQARVEYEDYRIEKDQDAETENDEWAELKPTTPFGKLPILEIDGMIISESRAIARYVAREHGLAGKDDLEAAKCDMLVDVVYDVIISEVANWCQETDRDVKTAKVNAFFSEVFPPFLAFLNSILKENNGGFGFLVGDELTWADITVAHTIYSNHIFVDRLNIISTFPLLEAFFNRILQLPNIKEWINGRPTTAF